MKVYTINEADASTDIDIKLVAVRASRYRVFGSSERLPISELVVVDLRDGVEPADFAVEYEVLDRHPMKPITLARRRAGGQG